MGTTNGKVPGRVKYTFAFGAGKRIRTGGRPLSNIIEGITKDLKEIPKNLKAKAGVWIPRS